MLGSYLKKDIVGWGSTLALPWSKCTPDVDKIHVRCRYKPKSGAPLFSESAVTIARENGTIVPRVQSHETRMPTPLK